jgi:DNA-directed RNA polymerase specialized sigma24 family protein
MPDLTDDELLSLWQRARELARRLCRRSLTRLRAGQGSFFQEDDFWQELFLEFWRLAQGWQRATPTDEAALWEAWRRRLWGGGRRVLQRAPQRLWQRPEWPVAPASLMEALDGIGDPQAESQAQRVRLPYDVTRLTPPPRAGRDPRRSEELAVGREALGRLKPAQRQLLYMASLAQMPPTEVALALGLGSAQAVNARVYRARLAVQGELQAAPVAPCRGRPLRRGRRPGQPLPCGDEAGLSQALARENTHLRSLIRAGYSLAEADRWLAAWDTWSLP